MNNTTKFIGLTLGAGLMLNGFIQEAYAVRPSRMAVSRAVQTVPVTDTEKEVRFAELNQQAKTLFEAKEYDKALKVLQQAETCDPSKRPGNMVMAEWLEAEKLTPVVRMQYEEAVKKHPEDPEAYLCLANLAIEESRMCEATLLLGRAQQLTEEYEGPEVRKNTMEMMCMEILANYSEVQEDWGAMLGIFQTQEKKEPENATIKLRIGLVLLKMGDEGNGLAKLEEAYKLNPEVFPPETRAAQFYAQIKNWEKAIALAVKAKEKYPEHVETLLVCTAIYFTNDQMELAQSILQKALELEPLNAECQRWKGELALADVNLAEAYKYFSSVLDLDHSNVNAAFGYIRTLLLAGSEEYSKEALNTAQQLVKNNPTNPQFLTHYAWALKENKHIEEGLEIFQKLLNGWNPDADSATIIALNILDQPNPEIPLKLVSKALQDEKNFVMKPFAVEIKQRLEEAIKNHEEAKAAKEEKRKREEAARKEAETSPEFDLDVGTLETDEESEKKAESEKQPEAESTPPTLE